ncbi:ABC transporter ATP-binding protein [Aliiruegeria lutimaris]|uniref:ATP-binding cassette, subfamily B, MsbA n=1 Tax=Aliiruegeria lutimaris TaxID=571298 RepID=A0A1G8Q5Y6_9RHOB|nr:ABC transporter ATP-binding protein [Aliiruegeria lutimaris]SDJ00038.1 ATP-binding cassette, subfamily B, MsbA [Aliiruegeria lutimaris]
MTLLFLKSILAPHRGRLMLLMAILLLESVITLSIPWVGGRLGGYFFGEGQQMGPVLLTVAILGLLAAGSVLRMVSNWLSGRTSETILAELRSQVFAQLQALPILWHQGEKRGSAIALISWDLVRLSDFATVTLVQLLPLLVTAGGACVMMLAIDPTLALLVPVLVPAFFILQKLIGRRLRGLGTRIQKQNAEVVAGTEEMLDLLPVIKSFHAERIEQARFDAEVSKLKDLTLKETRLYAFIDPAIQFVVSAATVVLLVLAGQSLRTGQLSASEAVSFLMYVALLVRPVSQLASVYGRVQTARGTLERLQDVMRETPENLEYSAEALQTAGEIAFDHVAFSYPGRTPALRKLTFRIGAGEIVALTGANGAGKSTAVGLLLGLYQPDSGRIILDGRDIADMELGALRRAIGYVPQSRYLRNATVRENIAFGMPDAPMEAIVKAARIAQAHDFVSALPEGYETIVGDKGVKLSGGQQQRISLARALLKNPPILILDEATSMYDLEGEAEFVAECRAALAGRTVILITHRPASLEIADRILVLENGTIRSDAVLKGMQT